MILVIGASGTLGSIVSQTLLDQNQYFDDCEYDIPSVAHHMNTLDAVGSVLDEDGKGGDCFDRMAFNGPFDMLGFFLRYMSGPILAESSQEREERMKHVVILPEPASASGTLRKKTREERWHSCECGCELDRDTASAKVILDLGRKALLGRDAANAGNCVEAPGL